MKKIVLLAGVLVSILSYSQNETCLDFDGVNDYVYVGDVHNLGVNDFTLEAWVYSNSSGGNGQKIINKGLTSVATPTGSGYGMRLFYPPTNTDLNFGIGNNGNYYNVNYNGIEAGQWYHVAGVRDKNELKLYVDGQLVATESIPPSLDLDVDLPLSVGSIDKGGLSATSEYFNGKIDEVRIWNYARSQQQIDENKDCAITSPKAGLLLVYNFDDNEGNTPVDNSGNDNHGIFMSQPNWVNSTVALHCTQSIEDQEEVVENEVVRTVYPNPVRDELNLDVEDKFKEFNLFDLSGKVILQGRIESKKIDLSTIKKGSYILQIVSDDETSTFNLLKQ